MLYTVAHRLDTFFISCVQMCEGTVAIASLTASLLFPLGPPHVATIELQGTPNQWKVLYPIESFDFCLVFNLFDRTLNKVGRLTGFISRRYRLYALEYIRFLLGCVLEYLS